MDNSSNSGPKDQPSLMEMAQSMLIINEGEKVAQMGHWMFDGAADRYLYTSANFANIYGYPDADSDRLTQIYKDSILNIVEEDKLHAHETFRACIEQGGRFDLTYRIRRPDGKEALIREVCFSADPSKNPDKIIMGIAQDVTDSQSREDESKRREEFVDQAEKIAGLGHWVYDEAGERYLFISKGYARIHGYDGDDLDLFSRSDEEDLADIIEEDRERVRQVYDENIMAGDQYDVEYRIHRSADGKTVWLRELGHCVGEPGKKSWMTLGTVQDVTEIKAREQDLKQRTAFVEQAERLAGIGHYVWDVSGQCFAYLSKLIPVMHGMSPETPASEFSPMGALEFIHPEDREKSMRIFENIHAPGDHFSQEFRVNRPDGGMSVIREMVSGTGDESGKLVTITGTIQDVTRQTQLETGMRHAQKMEAIGQLAAGIAHEYNNILVGVGGFAAMAQDSMDSPITVEDCLQEITRAASRAESLTRDLLTFSRNDSAEGAAVALDLNKFIAECEGLVHASVNRQDIDVIVESASEQIMIQVDPDLLRHAVTNFVINARDAMPDGGALSIGAHVLSREETEDKKLPANNVWADVYVADTGTGIDTEIMERLFEPFFSTKDVGKGTGLGLSIVHNIVERAGGFVTVDSEVGKGATFSINLPVLTKAT